MMPRSLAGPFAVILRAFKYSGEGQYPLQEKPTGEVLSVKGPSGYEEIDYEVDVKSVPNANERARELADAAQRGTIEGNSVMMEKRLSPKSAALS